MADFKTSGEPLVLVVEDEALIRICAADILEQHGYEVVEAATAADALEMLEARPDVRVLFTDINMPDGPDGIDGLGLARRAVEMRPDLRVIYTTGGALTDGMTALFVEGGTFLQKPYTRERLIEAVRGHGETAEKPGDH